MKPTLLPINYYRSDTVFDSYFPERIKEISKVHWTPLAVAKKAASFLAPAPGAKILDIGSGVGKFCIAAAHFFPEVEFYGIEQREDLVDCAIRTQQRSKLENVQFIHGNFTQINLDAYDGIYFYNAFAENLFDFARIDDALEYSPALYTYYASYLRNALSYTACGTRLVTYHGHEKEVPTGYEMVAQDLQKPLKMWIKS